MKKKIFIGVPIHRNWQHESEDFLRQNIQAAQSWEVHSLLKLFEESLIQRARNKILSEFLKTDAEYLFCLDDDIVLIEPFSIDLLINADKDLIGVNYVVKKQPFHPVFFPLESEYPDTRQLQNPFEVLYAGTGALLIKRAVVEKMAKKFKYPFDCFEANIPRKGNVYLSEDWGFCHRARQLGFKTFIHPKITVGHLGVYAYSINDYYSYNRKD